MAFLFHYTVLLCHISLQIPVCAIFVVCLNSILCVVITMNLQNKHIIFQKELSCIHTNCELSLATKMAFLLCLALSRQN